MTLRDHHRTLTYGGWAIGLGGLLSGVMPAVPIGGLMLALGQYYALSNLTGSRLRHLWRKPTALPPQASEPRRTR
jgi:hypothetical protein